MIVQNDEAECFDEEYYGDQNHEAEEHFVGACGELDTLYRHYGD